MQDPGSTSPQVSLVVATFNRAHDLDRLLAALDDQEVPFTWECIVVDDASTDATIRLLRDRARAVRFPLRWTSCAVNGGPAVARNVGWRMASGEVIAFTDDDCRPESNWLATLVRPIAKGAADITTGQVRPDPDDPVHSLWVHTFSFDGHLPAFATCNAAYRRRVLEQVDGFDEAFRAGEDVDLGHRAMEVGARHVHVSEAMVRHARTNLTFRQFLRTRVRWGDSIKAFKRHPSLRQSLYAGVFLRRHHATTVADLGLIAASAFVSPWGPPAVLIATILFDARRPAPLPGLRNRLHYASLNWVRQVVDVAVCVLGSIRARVWVL